MESNLLSLTGFKLQINSSDFKYTTHYAVSASFPSISLPEVNTPFRNNQAFVPGEKLAYDTLNIRIAIDEKLFSYREIFDWMVDNTKQDSLVVHDMILNFLTNHNNISRQVKFYDAFPTAIGGIEFSVQNTDVEYAFADVTFRYDYFEFVD
jgi:hypothetical protein